MTARMVAILHTNLSSPTIFATFEEGVGAAEDRLSMPIEVGHDMRPRAAIGRAPTYEALCAVGLIVTSAAEDGVLAAIHRTVAETQDRVRSAALLVALPGDIISASQYFSDKLPQEAPKALSVDGVQRIDQFAKIVEYHLTTTARAHLPVAETLDQAQAAVLEAPTSQISNPSSEAYVMWYGSLS